MKMNTDKEWLMKKAGQEDGCYVSAGGSVQALAGDRPRRPATGPGGDGMVAHPTIAAAVAEVEDELMTALKTHKPLNSAHEGYAVVLEELDELWEEVKKRQALRDDRKMRAEAKQVAAMALRFMIEATKPSSPED